MHTAVALILDPPQDADAARGLCVLESSISDHFTHLGDVNFVNI
jgi:hypothetical protein